MSPSGDSITITSKKTQALLAILAVANGEPVLRSRLSGLLWEDQGEDQARGSLHQVFTALRKALSAHGDSPLIVSEHDAAINPAFIDVDAWNLAEKAPESKHSNSENFLRD